MQRVAPQLGPLETRLMAWAQMLDMRRATSDEIAAGLRLDKIQCRKLLDRMNKRGGVVQLQRGLYLLPAKLPPGGKWTPAPAVILRNLFEAKGGQWQETGVGAFHFHGLSEQVPNTTSVYNTLFSKRDRIAGLEFEMIKVAPGRLGSVTEADRDDDTATTTNKWRQQKVDPKDLQQLITTRTSPAVKAALEALASAPTSGGAKKKAKKGGRA